jgi:cytochrome c oxidase assembly protein subunit 15
MFMTEIADRKKNKAIAWWLLTGVFMIIVQVLLGGITRLTGSGLSITEWKPIMGALPPLGDEQWSAAFEKYKQIAQFKYLNNHFTLDDFKFIFFWEWFHRLWARLLGVVFLVGFITFAVRRYFSKEMIHSLVILFLLGAMQGLIGWIMVASGLNDENLYVSHYRLAIHFIAALVLLCYTFWFAMKLLIREENRTYQPSLLKLSYIITFVLVLQLVYGAFMAGLKAASAAPSWPDINGEIIPSYLFTKDSLWQNLTQNTITIHFIHRTLAYILVIAVMIWTWRSFKVQGSLLKASRWVPLFFILLQLLLGIFAVLNATTIIPGKFGVYEWIAQLHQLVAMFFLMAMIWMIYLLKGSAKAA